MNAAPSVYRRPLPASLIPFSSASGRALFREALEAGRLEAFFPLIEQFHTQSDPAFCGLGSLVMVLNALGVDPGRVWRGPWRWFSEELLDCCTPLSKVQALGLTIDEVACLARCNGADVALGSPGPCSLEAFRAAVDGATRSPERMLIASYSRSALGQTGAGHFSPIGGYHAGSDRLLVLDVARFKYPPHWVPVAALYDSMCEHDPVTGRPRGWLTLARRATSSAVARFLVCSDGLGTSELVERVLASSAAALDACPGAGFDDALRVTAHALVESGLTERVRLRLPETDEHRALYSELEAGLTRLPLYTRAAIGLGAGSATAVTLWWLALEPVARRALSPAAEAELDALLSDGALQDPLRSEIELLRSQVEFLLQRPGARRVGSDAPAGGEGQPPPEALPLEALPPETPASGELPVARALPPRCGTCEP